MPSPQKCYMKPVNISKPDKISQLARGMKYLSDWESILYMKDNYISTINTIIKHIIVIAAQLKGIRLAI